MSSNSLSLLVSSCIFILSLCVGYISFTSEPSNVFVFPRVISVIFIILSVINLSHNFWFGSDSDDLGIDRVSLRAMSFGLIVSFIYIFFLTSILGFYTSSFLTFLVLYSFYDSFPTFMFSRFPKRLLITTIFMIVIYALFALVLRVQTPMGILL